MRNVSQRASVAFIKSGHSVGLEFACSNLKFTALASKFQLDLTLNINEIHIQSSCQVKRPVVLLEEKLTRRSSHIEYECGIT